MLRNERRHRAERATFRWVEGHATRSGTRVGSADSDDRWVHAWVSLFMIIVNEHEEKVVLIGEMECLLLAFYFKVVSSV